MAANVSVPNTFVAGNTAIAADVNSNFSSLVTWINTNAVHLDASKAFTAVPSGPTGTDPSTDDQLTRKKYVDKKLSSGTSGARPTGVVAGSLFWETDKTRLKVNLTGSTTWGTLTGKVGVDLVSSMVTASGAQDTIISYTENLDTDSMYPGGVSGTITVPEDGTYSMTVQLEKTAGNNFNATGGSLLSFVMTPRTLIQAIDRASEWNNTLIFPLSAGDTIVFKLTNGTNSSITYFARVWVRRISY